MSRLEDDFNTKEQGHKGSKSPSNLEIKLLIHLKTALEIKLSLRQVERLFLRQGLRLTFLGSILGLTMAWALTRFIKSLIVASDQTDPFFKPCR